MNRFAAINHRLFCLHVGLALWTLFGAAAAHRIWGWPWEWTALMSVALTNGYWAVLHEALHGNLDTDFRRNRAKGRVLAILFGSSFRVLRFGHLSHHRFNRHPLDRPDAYDPRKTTRLVAYLGFLGHTLGGQYLGEFLLPLLFWLPERAVRAVLGRALEGDDERLGQLRKQAMVGLANGHDSIHCSAWLLAGRPKTSAPTGPLHWRYL